jgi:hypothetical protein
VSARPITVCDASPAAPTLTVRAVRVGIHFVRVCADSTLPRGFVGVAPEPRRPQRREP